MSQQATHRMSTDEFLAWSPYQEDRHELIDGVPVAMTGATRRHDHIVMNVHALLVPQLRGHRCRSFSADTAVRIPAGNVRRPDAGIDCGPFDETATWAGAPFLVVEVLSPSTQAFDLLGKLEEYKTVPSLTHIVLIDPGTPRAHHWSRGADGVWAYTVAEALAAIISLPELPGILDLATVYEGLTFRSGPRLVSDWNAGASPPGE